MGWSLNNLTLAAEVSNSFTAPFAYAWAARGTQHVDYVGGQDFEIHELQRDNNGWQDKNLSSAAGVTVKANQDNKANHPVGYVFGATRHVIYVGVDYHVHELWWDNGHWGHTDLTHNAGAPLAAGFPAPCAYAFEITGTQHVDYVGKDDGHLHELWWDDSDGWQHHDLTSATGAPNPVPDLSPSGYSFDSQGSQHVDYIGVDGHVHELMWNLGRWYHTDLTFLASLNGTSPGASLRGSLAAYKFVAQGTHHVAYVGSDGHIHEILINPHIPSWHDEDLSQQTGTSAPDGGQKLCAYVFDSQGTRHIDYTDSLGHVYELWWDNDGWHYSDLTNAANAGGGDFGDQAEPSGYIVGADGTQHVMYLGISGPIYELCWDPSHRVHPSPPFPALIR